jgi:hypothetical protein
MKVAVFAAGLFLLAFVLHWSLWRLRVPRRQTAALLLIFLGVLPVGLAVGILAPGLRGVAPAGGWEVLHVAVFHVAVSLAYVVTYSALEEHSPSLTLVKYVAAAGARGCCRADLHARIDNSIIVHSRLRAMVRDRMAEEAGGVYRLTPKGRLWLSLFGFWRRLARLHTGG